MRYRFVVLAIALGLVGAGGCDQAAPRIASETAADDSAAVVGGARPRPVKDTRYTVSPDAVPTEPSAQVRDAAIDAICVAAKEFARDRSFKSAQRIGDELRMAYSEHDHPPDFRRIAASVDADSCTDTKTSELAITVLGFAGLGPIRDAYEITSNGATCAQGEAFGGTISVDPDADIGERRVEVVWQFEDLISPISGVVPLDVSPDAPANWSSEVLKNAPVADSCRVWIRAIY